MKEKFKSPPSSQINFLKNPNEILGATLTIFTITLRSHVYSYQWHNQLASDNNKSRMTTLSQNNHDMI